MHTTPYRSHWSDRSKASKIKSFAQRLPNISRKHGVIQRLKDKQRFISEAEGLLVNLSYWASMGSRVLVSRRKEGEYWHRLRVLDTLAAAGLIRQYIAPAKADSEICTEIEATDRLLFQIGHIKPEDILVERLDVLELRDKDRNRLPLPQRTAKALSPAVKRLNKILSGAVIELDGRFYPAPQYYRVFNLDMNGGGRWYHDYQNLSKEERQRMTINGDAVVELDFSALHPRLIYAAHGIQYDDDPYTIPGVSRSDAKLVFLQLLYDTSVAAARNHLKSRQNPKRIAAYERHRKDYAEWLALPPGERGKAPQRPKCLGDDFTPLDASIDVDAAIDGFLAHHTAIAEDFDKSGQAVRIQYRDALIAERVFAEHVRKLRPVLGVHDSFIVQAEYADDLRDIMAAAYAEITGGFHCPIK